MNISLRRPATMASTIIHTTNLPLISSLQEDEMTIIMKELFSEPEENLNNVRGGPKSCATQILLKHKLTYFSSY